MIVVITCAPPGLSFSRLFDRWCRGYAVADGHQHVKAPYEANMDGDVLTRGAAALDTAIRTALREHPDDDIVGFGQSQGGQVISEWLDTFGRAPDRPDPARVRFVVTGNPLRPGTGRMLNGFEVGGRRARPTPTDTEYRVLDVARRYDGWAIAGGGWRNTLGMFLDHADYFRVDLNKPDLVGTPVLVGNYTMWTVK